MTSRINFYSYNTRSSSVGAIRDKMDSPSLLLKINSPKISKILDGTPIRNPNLFVCWGNTEVLPARANVFYLNNTPKLLYINKRSFFEIFSSVPLVNLFLPFSIFNANEAIDFVARRTSTEENVILVERKILNGSGGEGIGLIRDPNEIDVTALLWTKYIKKKDEYRVHFFKKADGNLELFCQKKLLKRNSQRPFGQPDSAFKVRNFQNGWVYSHCSSPLPMQVIHAAVTIITKVSLDFGAIDIIYNERNESAHILEINTAPGAVETTAKWYADKIEEYSMHVNVGRRLNRMLDSSIVNISGEADFQSTVIDLIA